MDDHNSGGFMSKEYTKAATIFHEVPPLYNIPYGVLYSKNVENLMFSGRCISATHMGISSTRVMATNGVMGQAVGTAVSIAVKKNISPREVGQKYIKELQQKLMEDDCYLPGFKLEPSKLMKGIKIKSSSKEDPSVLLDGVNRPIGEISHKLPLAKNGRVKLELAKRSPVKELAITFDSMMETNIRMSNFQDDDQLTAPPKRLVKAFTVKADGKIIFKTEDNYQRFVKIPVGKKVKTLEVILKNTWGSKGTGMYEIRVK